MKLSEGLKVEDCNCKFYNLEAKITNIIEFDAVKREGIEASRQHRQVLYTFLISTPDTNHRVCV